MGEYRGVVGGGRQGLASLAPPNFRRDVIKFAPYKALKLTMRRQVDFWRKVRSLPSGRVPGRCWRREARACRRAAPYLLPKRAPTSEKGSNVTLLHFGYAQMNISDLRSNRTYLSSETACRRTAPSLLPTRAPTSETRAPT